ncbi:MAG: polyphenol oxidase family protein [Deltaproteobacteria bacterium]
MITSRRLRGAGFQHGFSTREGGVSRPPFDAMNLARNVGDDATAVAENHALWARAVGYDATRLAESSQVHGVRCLDVEAFVLDAGLAQQRMRAEHADALFAQTPAVAVGVRTADCVPVLVGDEGTGAVVAIHAGWRGAIDGVVPAALGVLASRGGRPDRWIAALGPHIRVASFEVGEDVADAIERALPRASGARAAELAGPILERSRGPRPHASLATLVLAQLLEAGLSEDHIDDVGGDTWAEPSRFHSYRRDGARSGRQLSVIVARPADR